MLSRTSNTASRLIRRLAVRSATTEAVATAATVKLNFNLPHEKIYDGASVASVIIPGIDGEYGVVASHVPYVAQLKPGVLQIIHEAGSSEPEKYFVAGGFALTHPDSTTDVVCPEAVKLEDIDPSAVTSQYEAAKAAFSAASAGSLEQAEAQIDMQVNRAMASAIGITVS